jgi:hypothetical protein
VDSPHDCSQVPSSLNFNFQFIFTPHSSLLIPNSISINQQDHISAYLSTVAPPVCESYVVHTPYLHCRILQVPDSFQLNSATLQVCGRPPSERGSENNPIVIDDPEYLRSPLDRILLNCEDFECSFHGPPVWAQGTVECPIKLEIDDETWRGYRSGLMWMSSGMSSIKQTSGP